MHMIILYIIYISRFIDIHMCHPGVASYYHAFSTSSLKRKLKVCLVAAGKYIFGDNTYVNTPYMATSFRLASFATRYQCWMCVWYVNTTMVDIFNSKNWCPFEYHNIVFCSMHFTKSNFQVNEIYWQINVKVNTSSADINTPYKISSQKTPILRVWWWY